MASASFAEENPLSEAAVSSNSLGISSCNSLNGKKDFFLSRDTMLDDPAFFFFYRHPAELVR